MPHFRIFAGVFFRSAIYPVVCLVSIASAEIKIKVVDPQDAAVGTQRARQYADQCGLPGPVGAEKSAHFARRNVEGDVVERAKFAELLANISRAQQRRSAKREEKAGSEPVGQFFPRRSVIGKVAFPAEQPGGIDAP